MLIADDGKSRMRSEIVEAMRGLHKVGAVSGAELETTTLRMLGKDALPPCCVKRHDVCGRRRRRPPKS